MAKKEERFQVVQQQGNGLSSPQCTVLLDSVTGVQYLFVHSGYAGGLCPLMNRDGSPLVWDV